MARQKKAAKPKSDSTFNDIDGYLLNAVEDATDFRDYHYQPALLQLARTWPAPEQPHVLDQGQEGACTGFGLAAVINLLLERRREDRLVSARMLYEMARRYDEWQGEDYVGSSCRGAIRGWNSMGVCSENEAPYRVPDPGWELSLKQAKDARATTLGAYYRVSKRLSDYHAAINEAGALYVSARVHSGWRKNQIGNGRIPFRQDSLGGHAFAIVGYEEDGFWVQNSWGRDWGRNGLALWSYEDWLENVRDAWVVRLALSTPHVWHLTPSVSAAGDTEEGLFSRSPKRAEIVGHFVHLDDGDFDDEGRYWMNLSSIRETAELVAHRKRYDHLLLYAHGGLNSVKASARRIVAMKEVFKKNGVYPFHFMYDTGLLEEVKDVVFGKKKEVEARAGGLTDWTDKLIEKATRRPGRAIWREMKKGAARPFEPGRAGEQTIDAFLRAFAQPQAHPKKIHLVGHSTGAILLAALLEALGRLTQPPRIRSCQLMAPACTHDTFNQVYRPLLKERDSRKFGISRMRIYNLNNRLERDDTVTPVYRKSLLYLVSNAFEEQLGERILGMQSFRRFLGSVPNSPVFHIHTSDGSPRNSARTASKTHGGFDNDVETMNSVLRQIVGPDFKPFTRDDLKY
jgi:pimeloyl-ACP methyl ester carboxylesterase